MSALVTHRGGCHCGQVSFEVDAPARPTVLDCGCSICKKTAYLHLIVPRQRFRLLSGEDALVEYRFNTGTARHLFCKRCGIKSFYVPRSHPHGYSVNLRCLEDGSLEGYDVERFDDDDREAMARKHAGLAGDPSHGEEQP